MAIEPIKGFYVHDEVTDTDGVAKVDTSAVDGLEKKIWTMADILPSPYGYVEYDTTEQTLTIPRDFTFYANGNRYNVQSETVLDVSYASNTSSTHIIQYVVSTGQFENKTHNTYTADANHVLICTIRGFGAGQNIGKLSINGPYKQDGYLYNINLEPYLNIDTYPYTYGYSEFYGEMQFNPLIFINANMSSGNVNPNSPSAATSYNIFQFPTPCTIRAEDGYRFGVHLLNNDGTFASDPGWQQTYSMPAGQKFRLIITNWPRSASGISLATAREWVTHVSFITEAQQISNPTSGLYHYYGERVSLKRHTYNCGVLFTTTKPTEITTGWQGSTVYDGKLFRLAETGDVAIYEMGHSTPIANFSLGSKADDNHANSCSFGAEKYSNDSAFPMLYVTAGSSTDIKLVVEDIHEDNGAYTSTKVQEITYDKSSLATAGFIDGWGWPCWVVDAEKGYLYTIGSIRQSSSTPNPASDNTNKMVFNKFKIPDKSIASVTLTAADLLEQWTTPFEPMLTQGACYYNGYIFAVYGLGSSYQNAICVYDTVQRAHIARLDCTLNQDPLYNKEPEDCAVYDNKLIVTTSGNDVYTVEFV